LSISDTSKGTDQRVFNLTDKKEIRLRTRTHAFTSSYTHTHTHFMDPSSVPGWHEYENGHK